MTQFYLVRVQRMTTCDEADMVAGWSAVVAEKDLDNLILSDAGKLTEMSLRNAPGTNMRPMTEAEIATWRADEANG